MRILLVDVPDRLGEPARRQLGAQHTVDVFAGDVREVATCLAQARYDVVVQGAPSPRLALADGVERATLGTWNVMTTTQARTYVQLSTMRLFDAYDDGWAVTEEWSPLPTPEPGPLSAHLAEITAREVARARPIDVRVLRMDDVVRAARFEAGPPAPTWLHIDDAVRAVVDCVLAPQPASAARWHAWHIVRGTGRYPLDGAARAPLEFTVRHRGPVDATPEPNLPPLWPEAAAAISGLADPQRVTVLGAGGPLGVVTVAALQDGRTMRVTDALPLAELATRPPQSPGAPVTPPGIQAPHEEVVVDVSDAAAVRDAARDADCLINCAVVRTRPATAFAVNVLGALHTMAAAVAEGVSRVVHTGPTLALPPHPFGYLEDRAVAEPPPRAGDDLYFLTKLLGQEICRIFAVEHRIACPILLFCGFVNPHLPRARPPHPFSVSWADAGRAMAAASCIDRLPEPSPVMHVLAPSPHGRYLASTAGAVLGWQPRDLLDGYWTRG